MTVYLKVRSALKGDRAALHDTDPAHPPSATFPDGGAVTIDQAGKVYIVAGTAGVYDAIAKERVKVVDASMSEEEALRIGAKQAIKALKKFDKDVPPELLAMSKLKSKVKKPAEQDEGESKAPEAVVVKGKKAKDV